MYHHIVVKGGGDIPYRFRSIQWKGLQLTVSMWFTGMISHTRMSLLRFALVLCFRLHGVSTKGPVHQLLRVLGTERKNISWKVSKPKWWVRWFYWSEWDVPSRHPFTWSYWYRTPIRNKSVQLLLYWNGTFSIIDPYLSIYSCAWDFCQV